MSRMMAWLLGVMVCLSAAAIRAQAPHEWPTYPIKEAPAALRPATQHGDMIIISIQNAVLSELTRELTQGGPGDAIQVCHMSATTIVHRIGREEGVSAGRTSARVRTPSNAPRAWAAPIVARYAESRAAGLDGFEALVARDGRYVPRSGAEVDRSTKQIIPYLVLRDGQRYFLMQRTAAGGDARLHGRYSIGVGGHLNPGDDGLLGGLRREWDEELVADFVPEFRLRAQ